MEALKFSVTIEERWSILSTEILSGIVNLKVSNVALGQEGRFLCLMAGRDTHSIVPATQKSATLLTCPALISDEPIKLKLRDTLLGITSSELTLSQTAAPVLVSISPREPRLPSTRGDPLPMLTITATGLTSDCRCVTEGEIDPFSSVKSSKEMECKLPQGHTISALAKPNAEIAPWSLKVECPARSRTSNAFTLQPRLGALLLSTNAPVMSL